MVMLILGVLAVVAMPRMLDLTMWRLTAFGNELQAQMQAMQRLALLQRRPVVATINTTGVSFDYVSGGSLVSVSCPTTVSPCISQSGPRTITFNASNTGSASTSTSAALPVTVSSGSYSKSYTIEAETGLFRTAP
jgi:type II secretory pathway pseudopilin PulG